MLIYNFQKEFLGIDEKDLNTLGFKDLAGLRTEVTDFADLFVKTPGFIHNFKHVHWIDFITCAESSEESKVIINVNNKNYKCVLQITTTYLVDSPSSKAYIITLNNLRELSATESERISGDITAREFPQSIVQTQKIFNTPQLSDGFATDNIEEDIPSNQSVKEDPYEIPIEIDLTDTDTDTLKNGIVDSSLKETKIENDLGVDEKFDFDDLNLDIDFKEESLPSLEIQVQDDFNNGYIYDPKVASNELGLPLDLIEEFIQDFIGQAKEFKEDLYNAYDQQDLTSLRILSHKLKGVAANLRIEDALETLSVINTSDDLNIIEHNLKILYQIISKLAGEKNSITKEVEVSLAQDTMPDLVTDTLDISFKDDDLNSDSDEIRAEYLEVLEIEEEIIPQDTKVIYSKEAVSNEIGIDIESFNELFDDYIQEANELHKVIQTALNNDDLQTCKNAALKLKGMSDNMRVTTFSNELETIIHANTTLNLQDSLNTIVTAIADLSNSEGVK